MHYSCLLEYVFQSEQKVAHEIEVTNSDLVIPNFDIFLPAQLAGDVLSILFSFSMGYPQPLQGWNSNLDI